MKRAITIATILAVATLTGAAAVAPHHAVAPPQQPATGDKPELSYYGDWTVRCFPVKSPSPCDMLFATVRKDTDLRVASVSIAYVPSKDNYVMQIAVPLGIDFSQGVVVAAGQFASGKMQLRRCDRSGCFVEGPANADLIQGLESNADQGGHLNIVAMGGKPVSLSLSLKGFAQARAAMVASAKAKAVSAP